MPASRPFISRRRFLEGAAAALSGINLCPGVARSTPEITLDGFSVVRAGTGTVRGPDLRIRRGDEIRVRFFNGSTAPAAIHWHGLRAPNAMDGAPPLTQPAVEPGRSFDYRFVPPDAGTFWYRAQTSGDPHPGLYGALIVEERDRIDIDRDVLLLLDQDALARGEPQDVPARTSDRVRFRFVNATSDLLSVRVADQKTWVMAIDGQPAPPFVARDGRIGLGPGNRSDLFVDARPSNAPAPVTVTFANKEIIVARLVSAGDSRPPRSDPAALPANALPARMDFANAQRVEIGIDDDHALARVPIFSARRGRTVVVSFVNRTPRAWALHLHGHSFRLLDRLDDGWKPFWLDSYVIDVRETARIAFVADNPGKWLIECAALSDAGKRADVWCVVA